MKDAWSQWYTALYSSYSGPSIIRTSIIRTLDYLDLELKLLHARIMICAFDKKIIVYMAAKSVVLSTEDLQVVGQGCLPLSSPRSSPCSQQLALLALFTATGKRILPIISLIRTFHLSCMVFLLLWPKGSG